MTPTWSLPLADQPQQVLIRDSFPEHLHQLASYDTSEVVADVRIQHIVRPTQRQIVLDGIQGVLRSPARPISVGTRQKVILVDPGECYLLKTLTPQRPVSLTLV
jgi:hypothetical protein